MYATSLLSWWPLLLFVPWAIALFIIDARTSRLPNYLTLPAIPAAGVVPVLLPGANGWALLGGLTWWAVAFGLPLLHPRLAAGGGDAKLALTTGTLAAIVAPLGALAALGLSGVVHCFLRGGQRAGRDRASPHGPAMLVATGAVVVASLIFR
ncbi:prepilin peptidase [Corynebacterium jeikeium]|uniref:prepilin peptidase n=1 Tax=Corynebacterium jeikeium TaxID=38289 RepID=UPI000556BA0C|nr:prepilin peptidase [Corynebacterium jeikeium]